MTDDPSPAYQQEQEEKPTDRRTTIPRPEKPNDYDDPVDEAADESFPASDPPSTTNSSATRNPER